MADFDYSKLIGAGADLFKGVGNFDAAQGNVAGFGQQATGLDAEAAGFDKAASLEDQNSKYALVSGNIQDIAATRKIYQSMSGSSSDIAGAGFAESGSGLDILRSSAEQGALTHAMIGVQTDITENTYQAQAGAYRSEAEQARSAAAAARARASSAGDAGIMGGLGDALGVAAKVAPFVMMALA